MTSLPDCIKLVSVYDLLTYGTCSTVVVPHMIIRLECVSVVLIKPYLVHTHTIQCQTHVTPPTRWAQMQRMEQKGPAKAKAKASIAKAKAGGLAKATPKAKEASSSRCTKELCTRVARAGAASKRANIWANLVLRPSRTT